MVVKTLLRNSASIEEWLAVTTFVKYCTLKKMFPAAINYKEKMIFGNYSTLDHSLFLRVIAYYFTKIFVHMSVIASVLFQRSQTDRVGSQQTFTCSESTVGH